MDINVYRKKFEGTFHLNSRRIPGGWMCRWDVKFGWDVNFDAADPLTSASDAGSPGSESGRQSSQDVSRTRGPEGPEGKHFRAWAVGKSGNRFEIRKVTTSRERAREAFVMINTGFF